MNPISDKNLDRLFQQRFEDIQIEPSKQVWEEISKKIDQKNRKKGAVSFLWVAAASIILFLVTTIWFFKNDEQILNKSGQVIVNQSTEKTIYEPEPLEQIGKSSQEKEKKINITSVATINNSTENNADNESLIRMENPIMEQEFNNPEIINTTTIASNQVNKQIVEQPKQVVKVPALYSGDQSTLDLSRPDLTAIAEDNHRNSDDHFESNVKNRKVRGVGGLVNFVISQVDKREDKLIEFKASDEGTELSGLNLGVLKIKSKK